MTVLPFSGGFFDVVAIGPVHGILTSIAKATRILFATEKGFVSRITKMDPEYEAICGGPIKPSGWTLTIRAAMIRAQGIVGTVALLPEIAIPDPVTAYAALAFIENSVPIGIQTEVSL